MYIVESSTMTETRGRGCYFDAVVGKILENLDYGIITPDDASAGTSDWTI